MKQSYCAISVVVLNFNDVDALSDIDDVDPLSDVSPSLYDADLFFLDVVFVVVKDVEDVDIFSLDVVLVVVAVQASRL